MEKLVFQNYTKAMHCVLDKCLEDAKSNPYDMYYLIVDSKKYFEEIVLKKQATLFNVEILTVSDLCRKILNTHHLQSIKKSKKDLMLDIVRYNKNHEDSLFHDVNNHYVSALSILNVLQNIYLYNVEKNIDQLPQLSQKKISTLFDIYHSVDVSSMYDYQAVLSCIDNLDTGNYYVLLDHYQPKIQELFDCLDKFGDVYFIENKIEDIQDYSDYVCKHLFDTYSKKELMNHPYSLLKASTIEEEVKQVVYDIFLKMENSSFKDFAIYYPSESYYQYLEKYFDRFNISYNKHIEVRNYAYKALHCLLEYKADRNIDHLVEAISSRYLKAFNDQYQISLIKTNYTAGQYINHAGFIELKDTLDSIQCNQSLSRVVEELKKVIKNNFVLNEESISLMALLDTIRLEDVLPVEEIIQLLDCIMTHSTSSIKEHVDSVYLLTYNQPYSELLGVKHVYMLGMNETVVPAVFKNTNFILNNEASMLHYPTTYDSLKQHTDTLEKVFSNRHESILLSYALAGSDGEELVVSSIVEKLTSILDIPNMAKKTLMHSAFKEELYLLNQYDDQEKSLNKKIITFKETKNQIPQLKDIQDNKPLSISKLEMYNQCPYKYFNQYVLHINKPRDHSMYINEIGTIIHYVLEKCSFYFTSTVKINKEELEKDIDKYVDEYLEKHPSNKYDLPQNKFIISMVRNDLYNTILVLASQMSQGLFALRSTEQEINSTINNINFKGVIDRVDIYGDVAKIIDYKSSQKELDLSLAKQGFKIQMLVYLDMLCRSHKLKPGAVLYFCTKKRVLKSENPITQKEVAENFYSLYKMDGYTMNYAVPLVDHDAVNTSNIIKVTLKKDGSPTARSKVLNEVDLQEIIAAISKLIEDLYKNIKAGIYNIHPTRSLNDDVDKTINPCKYCEYRSLCCYDIFYNEDRMIAKEDK